MFPPRKRGNQMEQSKEIKSIKKRKIYLELSDEDVDRVCKKAGVVGLNVSELLQNFIGDLVDGTYSNGSDERMYASQWFERCWFGMFPEKSFLRYLIEWNETDDFLKRHNKILSSLKFFKANPDILKDEDWLDDWLYDYQTTVESYADFYKGYFAERICYDSTFIINLQEEIDDLLKWEKERCYMQLGKK